MLDDRGGETWCTDTPRRADDKVAVMRANADTMEGLIESGVLSDLLDSKVANREPSGSLDGLRTGSAVDSDFERLKAELATAGPGKTA